MRPGPGLGEKQGSRYYHVVAQHHHLNVPAVVLLSPLGLALCINIRCCVGVDRTAGEREEENSRTTWVSCMGRAVGREEQRLEAEAGDVGGGVKTGGQSGPGVAPSILVFQHLSYCP